MNKLFKNTISSPIGKIEITTDSSHVVGINFVTTKCGEKSKNYPPIMKKVIKQIKEYFLGQRKEFDLPLRFMDATPFQRTAWQTLLKIPYGKTLSYGDQAKKMGRPKACRAVGNANGKNPMPIIVPCHRIIHAGGGLGGFSSGLWRKKRLLSLENI